MASILVRRDQFNITPNGIVHNPTVSHFAPHPGDPRSGRIHIGQLGVVPLGERYDPDQVKKMMWSFGTNTSPLIPTYSSKQQQARSACCLGAPPPAVAQSGG